MSCLFHFSLPQYSQTVSRDGPGGSSTMDYLRDPPPPPKHSRNRRLKDWWNSDFFLCQAFSSKIEPEEEKVIQSLPKLRQELHTNRIQKHTFLIFVKPSFWTTVARFCIDFKSPGIRTSMQKRSKSLPRRSITKVLRKNKPLSLFSRKTRKLTFKVHSKGAPKSS